MEPTAHPAGPDVVRLLLRCHRLQKVLAASASLSVDEFHCLSQLHAHAPCCVKTLCELLGVHPTRASRLLSALEKRGYLTRSLGFEDKRKELLTLTPAGVSAARGLLRSCESSVRDLAGTLSEDAMRVLSATGTAAAATGWRRRGGAEGR